MSSRVYTLDLSTNTWSSTVPTSERPTSLSRDASGGLLTVYPDFCAYDDVSPECSCLCFPVPTADMPHIAGGETLLFDETIAMTDTANDHDLSIAHGNNGEMLAVWVCLQPSPPHRI